MRKLIFLDIDGVLNSLKQEWLAPPERDTV
jgi:hypothetical protein